MGDRLPMPNTTPSQTYYVGVRQGAEEGLQKIDQWFPCNEKSNSGFPPRPLNVIPRVVFPTQTINADNAFGSFFVPIEPAPNQTFAHGGIGILGCITYRDGTGKMRHTRMHYQASYPP